MDVNIKSMKREDFKDNEYIDKLVEELNATGANVIVGKLDQLINWGRANSLWPLCFGTSCCAIEFMCLGAARYDMARFGFEVARNSPRQADYIMVQGTIVHRMAPVLRRLYEQLAEPKYVIAAGGCAVSGGPFKNSYWPLSEGFFAKKSSIFSFLLAPPKKRCTFILRCNCMSP